MRQKLPEWLISILVLHISMVLADRVMLIYKSVNATIGLYNGETYIQLQEGDRFAIECHSNESIQLVQPNITSISGYDVNKAHNRINVQRIEGGIEMKIAEVRTYHTGKYTCLTTTSDISFYIFVLVDPETIEIHPHNASSSKERRLRLRNMSASPIEIKEGESVEILISFDMFEPSGYGLQWFKTYYRPRSMRRRPVTRNITFTIHNQSEPYLGGGRLFIARADAEDAGIYELVASIGDDFKASFNWKVIVHPLQRRIDDLFMSSRNRVGDDALFIGKNAVINCVTNDYDITGITMQRSKPYDENWININSSELNVNKYTYKSLLKINVTLFEDTQYRCVDERNDEAMELLVRVSAIDEMQIVRVDHDDHILLVCQIPIGVEGDVYWHKDDEMIGPVNVTEENFRQNYEVDTSIFSSPYGLFECILNSDYDRRSLYYELDDVIVHKVPNTLKWMLGVFGVIISIAFIVCALFIVQQRRRNMKQANQLKQLYAQLMRTATVSTDADDTCLKNDQRPLHERIDQLPYERKYEIERERICFEKLLGSGEYGSVYLCRVLKKDKEHVEFIRAAAKRPRNRYNIEHYEALVAELRVMIAIGEHPNVLCLIGAVVKHLVSTTTGKKVQKITQNNIMSRLLFNITR